MARVIEPVRTPDICQWSQSQLSPPPALWAPHLCTGLLAYFRIIGRDQWPPPASADTFTSGQAARPHIAPGPGSRLSCFLFSQDFSPAQLSFTGHNPVPTLGHSHSCCCQETRVVFSSLRYLPPWCVYLPGFWWFSRSTSCTPWVNPWLLSWHCKLSF